MESELTEVYPDKKDTGDFKIVKVVEAHGT
jgi:hypothetical protein